MRWPGSRRSADGAKTPASNFTIGVVAVLAAALVMMGLWEKPKIMSALAGGDTIHAVFADSYRLVPHDSTVKVAGIEVGQITDVTYTARGTADVTMKVDSDALRSLGSTPTASIEPRTILGGRYVVELRHGGSGPFDGTIPLSRTSVPVELDRVLETLPSSTRAALRGLAGSGSATLKTMKRPLGRLLAAAPGVLVPGGLVVSAARGEHPDTDLTNLVGNLSSTADALTERDGQLGSIMRNLNATANLLAAHRVAIGDTLANLPATIRDTRSGIQGLDDSVVRLRTVAGQLMPSAPKLNDVVASLLPLLTQARPVMARLRPLLATAQPTVRELVPVARQATGVLGDLHGPVLDRVNGPVAHFLLNPWTGTGPFAGATDNYMKGVPVFQELAYMATNIDRASMAQDSRGSTLAFQVGAGADLLQFGTPFDLQDLLNLALKANGITNPATKKAVMRKAGLK